MPATDADEGRGDTGKSATEGTTMMGARRGYGTIGSLPVAVLARIAAEADPLGHDNFWKNLVPRASDPVKMLEVRHRAAMQATDIVGIAMPSPVPGIEFRQGCSMKVKEFAALFPRPFR